VAALGDFGGGIGAALMASTRGKKATRRTRAKTDAARGDGAAAGAETPA
jgi:hypothetical protein